MTNQHEHRHIHLDTGMYWWHTHPHQCDGTDFNALHHHPPVNHESLSFGPATVDGSYENDLHEPGSRPASVA